MIHTSLYSLAKKLSSHLQLALGLNNEIVELYPLNNRVLSTPPNKILISLVNIERETAGGINFSYQGTSEGQYKKNMPGWQLNLYIVVSAAFSDKQYEESLQILSSTIDFLQNNKNFSLLDSNIQLSIEPVNLQFYQMSNLWGILGGTYFPSILCKVRLLNFSSDEIKKLSKPIMQKETEGNENSREI